MESEKLYNLLQEVTQIYRKGEIVVNKKIKNGEDGEVTEIFGYKHTENSSNVNSYQKVDMIFVDIVVDKTKAEEKKSELETILKDYPEPSRLQQGPSYIEIAPNIGLEQESALRLMAVGEVLGMWKVLSAKNLGLDDEKALEMAGYGFLNISDYKIRIK